MRNFDHLSLDGRSLYMLKQIYEHRSVTEAARVLGVTQSSVSHSLDRLRGLLGDPLFLKVGRSMVPTERVESMMSEIDHVLEGIESLFHQSEFDPARSNDRFSIVGNDFEHDLLLPALFARLKHEAPNCSLRTHQMQLSENTFLKKGVADLELCPYPPLDTSDMVVSKICEDRMITYYDASRARCTQRSGRFCRIGACDPVRWVRTKRPMSMRRCRPWARNARSPTSLPISVRRP